MASSHPSTSLDGLGIESHRDFRCFNTDVSLRTGDWRWAHLLGTAEAFFHRFERRFSRFLADSELSHFNRREDPTLPISSEMLSVLQECKRLAIATEGVFNPLILPNLEAAGYDVSFENLKTGAAGPPQPQPGLSCLDLDPQHGTASLPCGLRIDLGGIGKGYAVDAAARLLDEAEDYLVDAGGDIYASGHAPDGGGWRVEVADPFSRGPLDVVSLSGQAIATSWTTRRRWRTRDGWAHHLIDPRTGLPTASGVTAATVIASRAVEADVFAKTVLILGPDQGLAFLEARGLLGLLVLDDGSMLKTSDWPST